MYVHSKHQIWINLNLSINYSIRIIIVSLYIHTYIHCIYIRTYIYTLHSCCCTVSEVCFSCLGVSEFSWSCVYWCIYIVCVLMCIQLKMKGTTHYTCTYMYVLGVIALTCSLVNSTMLNSVYATYVRKLTLSERKKLAYVKLNSKFHILYPKKCLC